MFDYKYLHKLILKLWKYCVFQEPTNTLKGHREAVSGVQWMDFNTVVSSGWDHLLKIWDCELGGIKQEIAGK